jgi:hypothetical protein
MRINPSPRRRFLVALTLCVGATGFWLWKTRTPSNTEILTVAELGANSVVVVGAPPAVHPQPASTRPGISEPRAVQETRAELAEARRILAEAQTHALEGVLETEHPATLARFAQSHEHPLAALSRLESRLRDPQLNPAAGAPLPGLVEAQAHFDAVRHLIRDEGLTVEEAEARLATKSQR